MIKEKIKNIITMEFNFLEVSETDFKLFNFIRDSDEIGVSIKVNLSKNYFLNHKKFLKQFKEYFGNV